MALAPSAPPEASAGPPAEAPSGFAKVLGSAQSGAPPGGESPPTPNKVGEEDAKQGPIAQAQIPDFLHKIKTDPAGAFAAVGLGVPVQNANLKVDDAGKASADEEKTKKAGKRPPSGPAPAVDLSGILGAPRPLGIPIPPVIPNLDKDLIQDSVKVGAPTGATTFSVVPAEPPPQGIPVLEEGGPFNKVSIMPRSISDKILDGGKIDLAVSDLSQKGVPVVLPPAQSLAAADLVDPAVPPGPPNSAGIVQDVPATAAPTSQIVGTQQMVAISAAAVAAQAGVEKSEISAVSVDPIADVQQAQSVAARAQLPVAPRSSSKTSADTKSDAKEKSATQTPVSKVEKTEKVVAVSSKLPASDDDEELSGNASDKTETEPDLPAVSQNFAIDTKQSSTTVQTAGIDKQPLKAGEVSLVVRQVADRMQMLAAARPKDGVTVQLQPSHLGTVTMTVKSTGGSIEAHISASNDSVKQALEQNRPLLGQAMEQRGLRLESVSIASQTNSSTSSQRQTAQQQEQQAQHARQMFSGQMSHDSASTSQVRQAVRSAVGVDLWI